MVATTENTAADARATWCCGDLKFRRPAQVMGILNVTPDSFSDGGAHAEHTVAVTAGERMLAAGASWLDVGGESTRPGAGPISSTVELARVLPVIQALVQRGACVSIDTRKAEVARAALAAGVRMVNDVSAGADPAMLPLIAETGNAIVLMHAQGTPQTMQIAPRYDDVVAEVAAFFSARMNAARTAGVNEAQVLLDPGIGFGKTVAHNVALLRALPWLVQQFNRPLVLGLSRKRFLGALAGTVDPAARDGVGHVLHALLAEYVALLRVHDVPGAVAALALARSAA